MCNQYLYFALSDRLVGVSCRCHLLVSWMTRWKVSTGANTKHLTAKNNMGVWPSLR